jgi:hypothetical protein
VRRLIAIGAGLLAVLAAFPVFAEDPAIPEAAITQLECRYDLDEDFRKLRKALSTDEELTAKGVYHYKVYLPRGYYQDSELRYPCYFIASPGGNAGLHNVSETSREGRIFIMLVESKNSVDNKICNSNFLAAHDDAVKRFRIQEGMKFTTGFSGGARCASFIAGMRPGFSGIILQGAGFCWFTSRKEKGLNAYYYGTVEQDKDICVYALFGSHDSNIVEIDYLKSSFPRHTRREIVIFEGKHEWAPKECLDQAIAWVEQTTLMNCDLPGISPKFYANLFAKADAEFAKGNLPDMDRYERCLSLQELAMRRKLAAALPQMKARIDQLNVDVRTLAAKPAMRNEIAARKAFAVLLKDEEKARAPGKKNAERELARLAKKHLALSAKYPATAYGKKAAEKAASLSANK